MTPDARTRTDPSRPQDGRRRTVLHALAETRGWIGDFSAPHADTTLRTDDGVRLAASWLPGPAGTDGAALVLLHGFAAHRRKPAYALLADGLARTASVLSVDLRGHGSSGGRSGLGGVEAADARAAVDAARAAGHPWVGLIGVSMGGTSAANAVVEGVIPDALVLVSTPGWIEDPPSTRPMQRLRRVWGSPVGRAGLRLVTGVRVVRPHAWRRPADPCDAVALHDGPTLVVHGDDDEWFPPAHAEQVAAAGGARAVLWREPGFGHAEDGMTHDLARRLGAALAHARATGSFPSRRAATSATLRSGTTATATLDGESERPWSA